MSNVSNPVAVGYIQNGDGGAVLIEPRSVFVKGNYAFVADNFFGDETNPHF